MMTSLQDFVYDLICHGLRPWLFDKSPLGLHQFTREMGITINTPKGFNQTDWDNVPVERQIWICPVGTKSLKT